MELHKGTLFHNRYLLVTALGSGASADVWKAKDTKANNLTVALKIFSQHAQLDSYGLQDFRREFTTVYNMKQSNLLPPTGYDICNGCPYLVMQYCENGSCSSMVGRADEDDVIKFLHDVAAGLEYLHDHNIMHLDVKPDNILLDDNCNFMVTDFGISVNAAPGIGDSNGASGGTRAYMGPERFEGQTSSASDIWALGATAVEMLTGDPPYGEHGGLLQAEGEPLPELPKLQPEVKSIILGCLHKDPNMRIHASEIRQKIELYWETGSWTKHSPKRTIAIIATAVASIAMCVGTFLWDYNRTKVYYYKDYCEHWGIPEGIGRLSNKEMSHREMSYKLEYRQHKLRHMSLVNSAGKVIPHTDTEHITSRYSDVYYFYTDNGKVDYTTIYNENGRMLFKMDYDENLKTATFRQNDEYGTEMNLAANTNTLYKDASSAVEEKSRISRYLLSYDDNGLLTERKYVGLQNVPAGDKDNIYGQRYKYDDKGRKIEEAFIGANGDLMSNSDGLAVKTYTYDDDDNWTSVTYLNAERKGSHDGNNCSIVKLAYDDYGNRIKETYFTFDNKPSIRTDLNISGFTYTYTEQGFRETQTCLGIDGKPAYCNAGIVTMVDSCNSNGFIVCRKYLDEHEQPALYNKDGDSYSSVQYKPNETGLPLEYCYFDQDGQPMNAANGVWKTICTFDKNGNVTSSTYLDKEQKPTAIDGFYYTMKREYDEFGHETREYFLDDKGKPATCDGIVADYHTEFNRQGAVTRVCMFDTEGKPVNSSNLCAEYRIDYDEIGNVKTCQYFNKEGKPCMTDDGYSKLEYLYDKKTNFHIATKYYNTQGRVVSEEHRAYDAKGNIIKEYTLVDGKLKSGTAVMNAEYDVNNRPTKGWYTNLAGAPVNAPKETYSVAKYEYDNMGNRICTTFWSTTGKPAVDNQKTHKRLTGYDNMNRQVSEKNLGIDGKPLTGTSVNPEGRIKYDKWSNVAEISCYDGYGRPRLSADGYFALRNTYNSRGNVLHEEYVGVKGELVCNKQGGYAKADYTYDSHGNMLELKYYDTKKCIRIEKNTYNDKNRLTSQCVMDGNGKLSDEHYGTSRLEIAYDKAGITPTVRKYYNQKGVLLATQNWNAKKADWDDLKPTAAAASSPVRAAYAPNWQDAVRADARRCPQQVFEGVFVTAINFDNSYVTVVMKFVGLSVDEGNYDIDAMRAAAQQLKPDFRKVWNLPRNVALTFIFKDKYGQNICTV